MTTGMTRVVARLQYDWNFIEAFLDDPEGAVAGYALSTEEHQALGLGEDSVNIALSGAHSSTCS